MTKEQSLKTGSEAYIARRIEHSVMKYLDHNSLFKNLPQNVQRLFLSQAGLEKEEFPVYGLYHDESTWIFATTRRLAWAGRGSLKSIKYTDIKQVSSPNWTALYAEFLKEQDTVPLEERSARYQKHKMEISKLVVADNRGTENDLHWEPETIESVWEIVTFAVRLDRIHKGDIKTKLSALLRKMVTRLSL